MNVSEEKDSLLVQKIYITELSKVYGDPTKGVNRSQYGFHCPQSATRTVAGPQAGPFHTLCDLKSTKSCVDKVLGKHSNQLTNQFMKKSV